MTTWRQLLLECMSLHNEDFSDIVSITLSESELDTEFDDGFGSEEGKPFTVWTQNRIYFPSNYDGSENVVSVSRHPDGKPTEHIGGG